MSAPAAIDRPSNAPEECVGPASEEAGKASACAGCPNQAACAAGEGRKEDPALREVAERLANVKHKILVLSGKGGVGKVRRDRVRGRSCRGGGCPYAMLTHCSALSCLICI